MADGSTKNIEDLKEGEYVLASDPETGELQARQITDTRNHSGVKHLITLTVDPDGKDGDAKPATITATDEHPFWLPDFGKWVNAEDLEPGMWLQTSAGTWVQVTAVDESHRTQRVFNLTVDGQHTYYVQAGATPVLVHNCGNEEEAQHAYIAADVLQQARYRATNESIPGVRGAQGQYGTTAVVGVRNTTTGDISIRTAVNHGGDAPNSWPQWAQNAFVQGEGHAETTILSSLADNEEVLFGAASRNVCWGCHGSLSSDPGIVIGGPRFRGGPLASPFRMFWRQ